MRAYLKRTRVVIQVGCAIWCATAGLTSVACAQLRLAGIIVSGDTAKFALTSAIDGAAKWVSVGDKFNDVTIQSYDRSRGELTIVRNGQSLILRLEGGSVRQWFHGDALPNYKSVAMLRCEPQANAGHVGQEDARTRLAEYLKMLRTPEFSDYVVQSFSHAETEAILAPFQTAAASPQKRLSLLEVLKQSITISEPPQDTMDFGVVARHPDPQVAALLANRWGQRLIYYLLDDASQTKRKTPQQTNETIVLTGFQNVNLRFLNRAPIPSEPESAPRP